MRLLLAFLILAGLLASPAHGASPSGRSDEELIALYKSAHALCDLPGGISAERALDCDRREEAALLLAQRGYCLTRQNPAQWRACPSVLPPLPKIGASVNLTRGISLTNREDRLVLITAVMFNHDPECIARPVAVERGVGYEAFDYGTGFMMLNSDFMKRPYLRQLPLAARQSVLVSPLLGGKCPTVEAVTIFAEGEVLELPVLQTMRFRPAMP